MTVHVLGGGPAGLALVDGLASMPTSAERTGEPRFKLYEARPTLGGLAQSVPWGDHGSHDLGPHKIFTKDAALMRRVEALLPAEDWLVRPKKSSIYLGGHFLPYPPSPLSLASIFGPLSFSSMVGHYGLARGRALLERDNGNGRSANPSFESDLTNRVGAPLYEALFAPIARKLWGDPSSLDVKLSQARVQTPSLSELVGRLLGLQKTSEFEALEFRYPRGGLQRIWQAIAEKARPFGEVWTSAETVGLEIERGAVRGLVVKGTAGAVQRIPVAEDDWVVSTLPLHLLLRLLGEVVSRQASADAERQLVLNDLLLVFFAVDRLDFLKESWIFVPDPSIAFHRVCEQQSFDPGMTPNGSIVCCEIMSSATRPMAVQSDEDLIALARAGLKRMGFDGYTERDAKVIRLPRSYPVLRAGFEAALERVLGELDGLRNLRTIGRQGAYNYIGTLDAMDIGYGAARWVSHADRAPGEWADERRRTRHYPVLD